jgi:hypothetical protein
MFGVPGVPPMYMQNPYGYQIPQQQQQPPGIPSPYVFYYPSYYPYMYPTQGANPAQGFVENSNMAMPMLAVAGDGGAAGRIGTASRAPTYQLAADANSNRSTTVAVHDFGMQSPSSTFGHQQTNGQAAQYTRDVSAPPPRSSLPDASQSQYQRAYPSKTTVQVSRSHAPAIQTSVIRLPPPTPTTQRGGVSKGSSRSAPVSMFADATARSAGSQNGMAQTQRSEESVANELSIGAALLDLLNALQPSQPEATMSDVQTVSAPKRRRSRVPARAPPTSAQVESAVAVANGGQYGQRYDQSDAAETQASQLDDVQQNIPTQTFKSYNRRSLVRDRLASSIRANSVSKSGQELQRYLMDTGAV